MKTSGMQRFVWLVLAVSLLLSTALRARQLENQSALTTSQPSTPQTPQAISQTGLLPVYGVDLRMDPAWVDQKQFPSTSTNFPNSGTNSTFQQIWVALQPGGYNVLRIALDVRDATAAANRAANLCVWAKNNNAQLILVLSDSDSGQPIGQDFPSQAGNFVKALVTQLRANNGQYLANYSQVMAFQLEDELNHVGKHGGMSASAAQQLALQAAKSIRQSEKDALSGTGTAATPLMVSASFDFELIKLGAIAGGNLSDTDYNQAYLSLKQFLTGLSSSSDLDLLTVDWFAGSLSTGGIDKAHVLLKSLLSDVAGKQIVFSAGFSTAFRSADEQKRLFATAFSNLSDLRASNGADCAFVGAIFHEALNGKNSNPTPPRAALPTEMDKWDWRARAAELTALWTQKKKSDDMTWWLARVENNMGLVSLQSDASGKSATASSPAQQGMIQIASAVSDVNAQMAVAVPANPAAYANSFQSGTAISATTNAQSSPGLNYVAPQTNVQPSANGTMASGLSGQPGCTNSNSYLNSSTSPYGQTSYGQSYNQPYNQPYGQQFNQTYGQQYGTPGTTSANCGTSVLAQGLQGEAQKGMMGLLDGVLQRLGSLTGGNNFGNAYNSYGSGYNNYGNTGTQSNPYSYSNGTNSTTPVTQYPNNYGGQTGYTGQPIPVTAGTVQVGPQDISLQPLKPQAGATETININLHNQNSTDVYGLAVQATGSDGTTFPQQGNLHLAPNASTSITIPWVPASANPSYSITVIVTDGFGNQVSSTQMMPVVVSTASSSNGSGNGTTGGGGTTGSTGTTGTTGTTGGTGTSGSGNGSGGTSGGSGTGSSVCTNSSTANAPSGAVSVTGIQLGAARQQVLTGQAAAIVVSLSNPNQTPLKNIKGSLCVDGNLTQNQTLSLLMPQQSRSLVFQGVTFTQTGQHQVSVSVDSQSANAQVLTASLTQQVTVAAAQSAGTTTGGVRKVGTSLPTAEGDPPSSPRVAAANVRSVTPPNFRIGHLVVPSRPIPQVSSPIAINPGKGMTPSSSVTATNVVTAQNGNVAKPVISTSTGSLSGALPPPAARPGTGLPPVLARPGTVGVTGSTGAATSSVGCAISVPGGLTDLSTSGPNVLAMSPGQPRLGQPAFFIVKISNLASLAPQGATAVFSIFADGQKVSESPRLPFNPPNQTCAAWNTTLPPRGQTIEVKAAVLANGATNSLPAKAVLSFAARVH